MRFIIWTIDYAEFSNSKPAPPKPFTTCNTSITILITCNVIILQQKHIKNMVRLGISNFTTSLVG